MNDPKIVITAASSLCSLGTGFDEVSRNLGTAPTPTTVRSFEFHEFPSDMACFRVAGYEPKEVLGKKGLRLKDWSTKLLLGAMELGFKEIYEGEDPDQRPGICVGTAFGSVESIGDFLSDSIVNGVNHVNPQLFANTVINSPTGNANIRYETRSLSCTVATGFNAGLDALIYACNYIRSGYLERIVAGGLDEVGYYTLMGLRRSGVYSSTSSIRPFGKEADGIIMGEGCGLVLVETEESAHRRGATILAEIAGTGNAFDYAPSAGGFNPRGEGARRAVSAACSAAGIAPRDAGFVAASASGNQAGDAMEAKVIGELFGDVPVAAYKSKTGECYGASPALSLTCALADLKNGRVSGVNDDYAALEGVNLVRGTTEVVRAEHAVVNAFSCDGNCSSVVIKNAG